MDNNLTIDLEELATILHLSPSTVKQMAHTKKHAGRLPPRLDHGGRKVLFLRSDVEAWLKERGQKAA